MNKYVLIVAIWKDEIILIEKQKPEWQKGKYNLIGGKVESGENLEEAARREFFEETGVDNYNLNRVRYSGYFYGEEPDDDTKSYEVHLFYFELCNLFDKPKPSPRPEEIEKVFWFPLDYLYFPNYDKILMKNLIYLIPLTQAFANSPKPFKIQDLGDKFCIEL